MLYFLVASGLSLGILLSKPWLLAPYWNYAKGLVKHTKEKLEETFLGALKIGK